jgi:hypothetical protein
VQVLSSPTRSSASPIRDLNAYASREKNDVQKAKIRLLVPWDCIFKVTRGSPTWVAPPPMTMV